MSRPTLAIEGYEVHRLLDRGEVDDALAGFERLGLAPDHAFHASNNELPVDERRQVRDHLLAVARRGLARVAGGHVPFIASYLTKGAHRGATVAFHQDLTYTDERVHRCVVAWVPLVDAEEANGAMQVVPGSHRWADGCRPSGFEVLPTEALQDELAARARCVPLKAGDALLYDPGLIHGSGPNTSPGPRPAAGWALAPAGADLVHVHRLDDGTLGAWTVDADYHLDPGLRIPPARPPDRRPWASAVTTDDLRRGLVASSP